MTFKLALHDNVQTWLMSVRRYELRHERFPNNSLMVIYRDCQFKSLSFNLHLLLQSTYWFVLASTQLGNVAEIIWKDSPYFRTKIFVRN